MTAWRSCSATGRAATGSKNITASGGGRLKRYGRTFEVADPHVVTKAEAAEHVTGLAGKVFPKIPFDNGAVLLRRV